jgi:phosphoadenosine phosphosulfate reductase
MSLWKAFEQASRLRYTLPGMARRIRDAERITAAFLRRAVHPYVAFSTGKDSLVALDITLRLRPDTAVLFHDENWLLPGTRDNVAAVEAFYGTRILRVRERYADDEFFAAYGVWPRCDRPAPVDFEADHWSEIDAHYGFDGAIIALRAEESAQRRRALRQPLRWHKTDGQWRVSPVHDWSYQDIWAYIIGRRLPYHPAYPAFIEAGVPPVYARIGPLTAVRVYSFGTLTAVKRLWPSLWNEFVAQNPCVEHEA